MATQAALGARTPADQNIGDIASLAGRMMISAIVLDARKGSAA